jgi:hypothetical protein
VSCCCSELSCPTEDKTDVVKDRFDEELEKHKPWFPKNAQTY